MFPCVSPPGSSKVQDVWLRNLGPTVGVSDGLPYLRSFAFLGIFVAKALWGPSMGFERRQVEVTPGWCKDYGDTWGLEGLLLNAQGVFPRPGVPVGQEASNPPTPMVLGPDCATGRCRRGGDA